MTVPVRVTFRDIPHSDAVLHHVERRAAKLDTYFDKMIKCHVVVEEPHRHSKHGARFHVRIDMYVPGSELVISRSPEHEKEDLHVAIDGAFADAERVLEDWVTRHHDKDTKPHSKNARGIVTKLFESEGYGFLETEDQREVYFHKNSVLGGRFERLQIGAHVRFAEEDGDKGPQASTVAVHGR